MKDCKGNELHINDNVKVTWSSGKIMEGFVRAIIKSKTPNRPDICMVKPHWAKNGGFGSCLIYPCTEENIELT